MAAFASGPVETEGDGADGTGAEEGEDRLVRRADPTGDVVFKVVLELP